MYRTARKRAGNFVIGGVLTAVFLLIPQYTYAFSVCDYLSFALKPFGLCTPTVVVATPTPPAPAPTPEPIPPVVPPATPQATTVLSESTTTPTTTVSTTPTPTPDPDWEGYAKRSQALFASIVSYLERDNRRSSSNRDYVTRETFDKQTDRIFEVRSDSVDTLSDAFTTNLLTVTGTGAFSDYVSATTYTATDPTATSTFRGALSVGTTTSLDTLTLDGALYLASTIPTVATNRLYNNSGDLYWNGSVITSSTTGNWSGNGSDVYRLTGNVGVGTGSPQDLLHVYGGNFQWQNGVHSIRFTTPLGNTGIIFNQYEDGEYSRFNLRNEANSATTSREFSLYYEDDGYGSGVNIEYGGKVGVGTLTPAAVLDVWGDFRVGTSASPTLYVDPSSGHVAFGTTSTRIAPNGIPDTNARWISVTGNTADSFGMLEFVRTTDSDGSNVGGLTWSNPANANSEFNNGYGRQIAMIRVLTDTSDSNASLDSGGEITFFTKGETSSLSERMRITSDGNVGIGTTSPSEKLEVTGNIVVNDPGSSSFLRAVNAGGVTSLSMYADRLRTLGGGDIAFQMTDTEVMRITNSGNVGIGTTTPTTKLQVDGIITPDQNNTYTLGNSTYRWSEVYASNGTINTSDARLKENVTNLTYGLDALTALEPVFYTWKDNPEQGTKIGLLAQAVEAVIPEVVVTGDDADRTKGIRYSEIIPIMINSIKELATKVADNFTKNEAQDERIVELEEKVAEIELLKAEIASLKGEEMIEEPEVEDESDSENKNDEEENEPDAETPVEPETEEEEETEEESDPVTEEDETEEETDEDEDTEESTEEVVDSATEEEIEEEGTEDETQDEEETEPVDEVEEEVDPVTEETPAS